jgi:hypothetical protein
MVVLILWQGIFSYHPEKKSGLLLHAVLEQVLEFHVDGAS